MNDPMAPSPAEPAVVRARTLPLQGIVNKLVRGLLRTPIVCTVVGRRLMTLYVTGRRSGRHYAVPVAYTRHNGNLLVGSQFPWIRNLRTGEPVDIRLIGTRRQADVEVLSKEDPVVEYLALMARDNHQFARLNRIDLDPNGQPDSADLHLAWAAGARVAMLTPR